MLEPLEANANLQLKISIDRGRSMRLVENVLLSWEDLVERLSKSYTDKHTLEQFLDLSKDAQNKAKQDRGYFVGSQMRRGVRDKNNMRERQVLTFDIDQGTPELLEDLRHGRSGLGKIEYVVHSTRTHGGDKIKLRLIIPLAKPIPHEHFQAISRVAAWHLDFNMVATDPVSFVPGQIMYWPAHCRDVRPVFIHRKGPLLNVYRMLEEWAGNNEYWKDFANLPLCARERGLRENMGKQAQNPLEKRGIVGSFCRTYSIHDAIEKFDLPYEPSEVGADGVPTRYTYTLGTSSNGVQVYEDGHIQSWHGSDPASGLNLNAFDLTRIHRFGDQDVAGEKEITDPRKVKSYIAMVEWLQDDADVMAELRDSNYNLTDDDVDEMFYSDNESVEISSQPPVALADDDDGLVNEDWRDSLDMNEKGTIKPTLHNYIIILRNHRNFKGRFGFNEFTYTECLMKPLRSPVLKIDKRLPDGKPFRPLAPHHHISIKHIFTAPRGPKQPGLSLQISKQDLEDAITEICQENPFHPVRDYLNGLTWDGIPRLDTLWIKTAHTPDTPYYRETARILLTAAVARVMSPGCKFDFMPVLIGPQGTLKSTAIKVLFSFAWSTENKGHFDSKKEFVEESAGFWVIEHDEMADFGRAKDEEGIKSTLSRTHDTVREAYGRKAGTVPRQCVLVGTTNKTTFLRTSHRRIWPINCGERSLDTAWLRANRDQLWAEAVHAYREMDARSVDGILPLYLHDKAAAVEFAVLQPGYLMPDADEANSGAVQEWLDRPTPKSVARPGAPYEDDIDAKFDEEELVQRTVTCGKEIWEKALGNDPTKYDSRAALAVGRIMEFLQTVWTKADPVRCGKYGVQRVYRRISTRRDRKKAR